MKRRALHVRAGEGVGVGLGVGVVWVCSLFNLKPPPVSGGAIYANQDTAHCGPSGTEVRFSTNTTLKFPKVLSPNVYGTSNLFCFSVSKSSGNLYFCS